MELYNWLLGLCNTIIMPCINRHNVIMQFVADLLYSAENLFFAQVINDKHRTEQLKLFEPF